MTSIRKHFLCPKGTFCTRPSLITLIFFLLKGSFDGKLLCYTLTNNPKWNQFSSKIIHKLLETTVNMMKGEKL